MHVLRDLRRQRPGEHLPELRRRVRPEADQAGDELEGGQLPRQRPGEHQSPAPTGRSRGTREVLGAHPEHPAGEEVVRTSETSAPHIGFLIAWATLAAAGVGFFQQGSNAKLKRRWYPWYLSLSWIVVVSSSYYSARGWGIFLALFAITPLFIFSFRITMFCEVCGAPWRKKKMSFHKPMTCACCGACFHGW